MDSEDDLGRQLVLTVIVTTLGICVVIAIWCNVGLGSRGLELTQRPEELRTDVARLLLTALLCFLLYRGVNWARVVLGGLLMLGSVFGFFAGFAVVSTTDSRALLLTLAVVYAICAYILLLVPAVRTYCVGEDEVRVITAKDPDQL